MALTLALALRENKTHDILIFVFVEFVVCFLFGRFGGVFVLCCSVRGSKDLVEIVGYQHAVADVQLPIWAEKLDRWVHSKH